MDGVELREQYLDALLDRITETRYPSQELLDRAENLVYTREHAERLVRYLIATVQGVQYPSHQLMDRVERILFGIAGR
jgi:tRNA G46 methylase TrmB